jgi:hypothetical protein
LDPETGEGEFRAITGVGAIVNLPVLQVAAASKSDSAGADAAERAGDAVEIAAGEDAGIGGFLLSSGFFLGGGLVVGRPGGGAGSFTGFLGG